MTYEEALEIAMEELYVAVDDLRYNNKGYQKHIEKQCNRLLTARNAIYKGLESGLEKDWEWVGLTDDEILDALGALEAEEAVFRVARAVESKLKEKNT
jgi:hypothetical protein